MTFASKKEKNYLGTGTVLNKSSLISESNYSDARNVD